MSKPYGKVTKANMGPQLTRPNSTPAISNPKFFSSGLNRAKGYGDIPQAHQQETRTRELANHLNISTPQFKK